MRASTFSSKKKKDLEKKRRSTLIKDQLTTWRDRWGATLAAAASNDLSEEEEKHVAGSSDEDTDESGELLQPKFSFKKIRFGDQEEWHVTAASGQQESV